MEAKVTWKSRMSFEGAAESGFSVPLGADSSVGGDNDGLTPMELIAIGLAGCTAMDVISILKKKHMDVTNFEVRAHLDNADEHPRVFTHATLNYVVSGHAVEESALVRAIELSATRYCPAQAMLSKAFPIALEYEIYEEHENGERHLVKQGKYLPESQ
ncbi:MAG: OsmC family protein [Anaerolineaceae bacterium]